MKTKLLLSLTLSVLAANVFALPRDAQPTFEEVKDSQQETRTLDRNLAEGGADRLLERVRVAADGTERTPGQQRFRVAADGADRTLGQKRFRVAADGADRTPGRQHLRVAEGGSERLLEQRHAG
ncbi:hypothetical protein [Pseudomonas sp. 2FG]|uniref:hypothetical protein n=1 Tax=Pseudomonas sp. 2FG TaxID=2502191 RepID=UPI0010F71966|nr:hypothetical protein [Pseudomonas sp. 2FG]